MTPSQTVLAVDWSYVEQILSGTGSTCCGVSSALTQIQQQTSAPHPTPGCY